MAVPVMRVGSPDIVAPLAGDRSMRGVPTVERLRREQREALQRRLVPRDYRRGELVYSPGSEARHLFVVLSGVARLSLPAPSGRRILLHLLPAGEIFGHSALVGGGGDHLFEAVAYTALRVGRIRADHFLEVIAGRDARALGESVSILTERWIRLVQRLALVLAQDLQARVAASLIEAARGFGVEDARGHVFCVRITQDALADLSAGSVRKVNAVLRKFTRDGLIGRDGGRLILRRPDVLTELALEG
jgi:CRP/FNR family transcriptional regulator